MPQHTINASNINHNRDQQLFDINARLQGNQDATLTELIFSIKLSTGEVMRLANALEANTTLQSLSLRGCKLSYDARYILEALKTNTTLIHLDLSDNELHHQSAEHLLLSEVLGANKTLKSLSLADNGLGVSYVNAIVEAVKKNATLVTLDLSNNNFIVSDRYAIVDALANNSNLTHLNLDMPNIDASIRGLAAKRLGQFIELEQKNEGSYFSLLPKDLLKLTTDAFLTPSPYDYRHAVGQQNMPRDWSKRLVGNRQASAEQQTEGRGVV